MPGGRCAVWLGHAPAAPRPAADGALLDGAERERADRMTDPVARAHYIAARAGIRRTLGAALGIPPAQVSFGRAPCPGCGSARHGPPVLLGQGPRSEREMWLSVSRAGPWWLLALSYAGPVGVDLEVDRTDVGPAVLRRCFSDAERARIAALPAAWRQREALRGWVRKEAVTKGWGTGTGTAAGLGSVEVLAGAWPAGYRAAVVRRAGRPDWPVAELPLGRRLVGALAGPVGRPGDPG
ncbi:4'-phosphopantetheinyl transferase superfamily protein [Streptomyces sp. JH002]|uniref:4'-phosphopantetheinyl transferase family protein n=1 Tax=Streptomyces sp. JH002 TaxID=2763259 RepID=UPI003D80226E